MAPPPSRPRRVAAPLCLLALAACGGGGGGSPWDRRPGNPGFKLDEGSFSVTDFAWQDPRPPDFHPFGSPRYRAVARRELVTFVRGPVPGHPVQLWDDWASGRRKVLVQLDSTRLGNAFTPLAAVAGRFTSVDGDELCLAGLHPNRDNQKSEFRLRVFRFDGNTDWKETRTPKDLPNGLRVHVAARLQAADFDGDGFDEIALLGIEVDRTNAVYAWIRLFDDPAAGMGDLLAAKLDLGVQRTGFRLGLAAGDLDGDRRAEILLHRDDGVTAFRLVPAAGGRILQKAASASLPGAAGLLAGEFDGRPKDEIAVVFAPRNGRRTVRFLRLGGGGFAAVAEATLSVPLGSTKAPAWISADLDGDRIEEVLLLHGRTLQRVVTAPAGGGVRIESSSVDLGLEFDGLQSLDDDGDGRDELRLNVLTPGKSSTTFDLYRTEVVPGARFTLAKPTPTSRTVYAIASNAASALVSVPGDFDREALVLKFTGRRDKSLFLGDPIPYAFVTAPPAKGNIGQAIAETGTALDAARKGAPTHRIRVGPVLGLGTGTDPAALGRVLNAGVRRALAGEVARTMGSADLTVTAADFLGPWNRDAVLFAGVLYQGFRYEIAAAPEAGLTGGFLTVQVPVAARLYRWSADRYEARMPAHARFGKEPRPHRIGDPATYLRRFQIEALLRGFAGRRTTAPRHHRVGHGHAEASLVFDAALDPVLRSFGAGVTSRFRAAAPGAATGPPLETPALGADYYRVEILSGTRYRGMIGDLPDQGSLARWGFDWGLFVVLFGITPDGRRLPGRRPLPVVGYWVDQLGSGY